MKRLKELRGARSALSVALVLSVIPMLGLGSERRAGITEGMKRLRELREVACSAFSVPSGLSVIPAVSSWDRRGGLEALRG